MTIGNTYSIVDRCSKGTFHKGTFQRVMTIIEVGVLEDGRSKLKQSAELLSKLIAEKTSKLRLLDSLATLLSQMRDYLEFSILGR